MPAKKTALYNEHLKAGARMVEFAGYYMPLQYDGISAEHLRVRSAVGLFDVSHMGEVAFRGPRALEVVQRILTNDVGKIPEGKAVYSPVCLPTGGIVDDVIAYKFSRDYVLLCVNAANREKDFLWFKEQASGDCDVDDLSDYYAQIAVQGPKAPQLLARVFGDFLLEMRPFTFRMVAYEGREAIVATTGYTGEPGGEVYVPNEVAEHLWNRFLESGKDLGVGPAGLGARDTLRMEMKYCLYGNDIDETTTPLEAGIGWTVKFDKGEFVGREALLRQKEEGIKRSLVAFVVQGKGIPRHGYKILAGSEAIGYVTSGAQSPSLGVPIGLGYVNRPYDEVGTLLEVDIKGFKRVTVRVEKAPLVKRSN